MERPLRLGAEYASPAIRGIKTMNASPDLPDVFSEREIARAAGVRPRDVRGLVAAGLIQPVAGRFFAAEAAVFAVRSLAGDAVGERTLFRPASRLRREPGLP